MNYTNMDILLWWMRKDYWNEITFCASSWNIQIAFEWVQSECVRFSYKNNWNLETCETIHTTKKAILAFRTKRKRMLRTWTHWSLSITLWSIIHHEKFIKIWICIFKIVSTNKKSNIPTLIRSYILIKRYKWSNFTSS